MGDIIELSGFYIVRNEKNVVSKMDKRKFYENIYKLS